MALSSFGFKSANALLFFQCAVCVIAVRACAAAGLVKVEPLSMPVVRVWLPVNVIFVGMIGTSFWALASLNVAMVTGERGGRGGGAAGGVPRAPLLPPSPPASLTPPPRPPPPPLPPSPQKPYQHLHAGG